MSILVIAEATGAGFRPSTFELLAQARTLDEPATAVLVGEDASKKGQLDGLAARVLTVTGANVVPYSADAWVDALTQGGHHVEIVRPVVNHGSFVYWVKVATDSGPRLPQRHYLITWRVWFELRRLGMV